MNAYGGDNIMRKKLSNCYSSKQIPFLLIMLILYTWTKGILQNICELGKIMFIFM